MTSRIRRPSDPARPLPSPKRTKLEKRAEVSEPKTRNVTEIQYMELAKNFQQLMNEKFTEIKKLKLKLEQSDQKLEQLLLSHSAMRRGYLRCIHELAERSLGNNRLSEFKIRSHKSIIGLHSFVTNMDVYGAVMDEPEESSSSSETEEEEAPRR